MTANTSLLASDAAVASAQNQLGSALLVSQTRLLETESGRSPNFALQTAVAARVSNVETAVKNFLFVELNLKDCFPQVSSPHQTTLEVTLTTSIGQ